MAQNQAAQAAPKKSNIYKGTIRLDNGGADGSPPTSIEVYVRAKTRAGAMALLAKEHITVDVAKAEDLVRLAGLRLKGG